MTQQLESATAEKPLNSKQRAFARELGVALASGGRDDELVKAYVSAGYAPDRGNARRLAADPRVRAIADEACAEALRLAGLHIGYLQAKALELLHASPTGIHRAISKCLDHVEFTSDKTVIVRYFLRDDLTAEEQAELDAATWPLSKFKITKDGEVYVELPDKKGIIEMLAKQLGVGKDESNVNVGVTLESLVTQSLQAAE